MKEGNNRKVVTRFAPSPTGFLHIGGIRTALYAWLWAKKNNGTFILRIEDTDKGREVSGSVSHIKESLKWFGINPDEGPDQGGDFGPYVQSERLDIYKKYALFLIEKGYAYSDPFSKEELEVLRQKAEKEKKPFLYREHRKESLEAWDGKKPLRFKIPKVKESKWEDVVYGELSAGEEALDDFILIKSDGYPTYNFAHIVDDIEMGVTHVMRGNEFISSTPKFLALYEALGKKSPVFVTLPPILAPGGKKKLSKRDGAKDLMEYKKEGYLQSAMLNFLAFLGWNPGGEKEVYTTEELIRDFDINKIQKSGAQLDEKKLDWINKEHLKKLSEEEVEKNIFPLLPEELRKREVSEMLIERINKWSDVEKIWTEGELDFLMNEPVYDKEKLLFKSTNPKQIVANLNAAIGFISSIEGDNYNKEFIKEGLMDLANSLPTRGELLHPVRFALSGKDRSPDPFTIASILGKDESIKRLQKAANGF